MSDESITIIKKFIGGIILFAFFTHYTVLWADKHDIELMKALGVSIQVILAFFTLFFAYALITDKE